MYDPLVHTPSDELYALYAELLEHHPVYYSEQRDVWCVSRYDSVLAAARGWEELSNAHGVDLDTPPHFFGSGDFLDQDPPRHDVLRQLVRARFTPRGVKLLEELVAERVDELLDRVLAEPEPNLARSFAWELPMWVICRLLGIPDDAYGDVQASLKRLATKQEGVREVPAEVLAGREELRGFLADVAASKRERPADDLLTDLVAQLDAGEIDLDDLLGMSLLMFVAGSETAASLISNALHLLDRHPDQQALLRSGEVTIEQAIEELLRYESPIQYLARTTTREVEVDGVAIPAHARVALLYGAANRDPRRYEQPDVLDLAREQKRHLAFGNGIHFCLGAPLARLEARIALTAFFERVERYEVSGPPTRLSNHVIRGITDLPARVVLPTARA
jgi:cytochrome P450